jgi:hypothetical protein
LTLIVHSVSLGIMLLSRNHRSSQRIRIHAWERGVQPVSVRLLPASRRHNTP